jgi:hypothetical protein
MNEFQASQHLIEKGLRADQTFETELQEGNHFAIIQGY